MAVKFLGSFCLFSTCLLVIFLVVQSSYDSQWTKVFNSENFLSEIDKTASFVKFYAPWCSHCVKLAPIWEELAEMLNDDEGSRVRIAEVDCTQETSLCNGHDITGYPTLKFFKKGDYQGIKYRGPRDFPSFSTFINENLEDDKEDKDAEAATDNPDAEGNLLLKLLKGKYFIMFFAPWCGHSQKLAPIWEELAQHYKNDPSINIEKIDCTINKMICSHYDVRAYPSLYWLQNGRKVEKYEGHRNVDDFKHFVDDMIRAEDSDEEVPVSKEKKEDSIGRTVLSLTSENFKDEVSRGLTFVKFYAPWCGHSQMLVPVWEELGKLFENKNVKFAKVDCTVEEELCKSQNVDGYPTLLLYKEGVEKPVEYDGHRHKEFIKDFLSSHSHSEL